MGMRHVNLNSSPRVSGILGEEGITTTKVNLELGEEILPGPCSPAAWGCSESCQAHRLCFTCHSALVGKMRDPAVHVPNPAAGNHGGRGEQVEKPKHTQGLQKTEMAFFIQCPLSCEGLVLSV